MTTDDRFELTVADLFGSVGRPDASDLVHDVLAETATMRQRPSWAFASRWLPRPVAGLELRLTQRQRWIVLAVVLLIAALLAVGIGQALAPRPLPTLLHDGRFAAVPSIPETTPGMVIGLADGRVLLQSDARGDGRATLWNPRTGTFERTGRMVAPGRLGATVLLEDGRVLMIGGDYVYTATDAVPSTSPTAEIYDPATGTFTSLGALPDPLFGQLAVRLDDGRVLITAGAQAPGDVPIHPLGASDLFDPTTGTFVRTGALTQPRFSADAVKLGNGRVLVVGGALPDATGFINGDGTVALSAELYDPGTGRFSPTGSLPSIPRDTVGYHWPLGWWGPLVALADGRAMVVGLSCQEVHDIVGGVSPGIQPTRTYTYDPGTSSFVAGPMLPHCVQRAYVLPDGLVFVSGWWYTGADTSPTDPVTSGRQHRWSGLLDPRTGVLRETDPPPGGPYLYLMPLPDGSIVVRSGEDRGAYLYR